MGNGNKILVGKPEGKRQFGSSRIRWEDNVKMEHQEIMLFTLIWLSIEISACILRTEQ
jgi:hypothetical protein